MLVILLSLPGLRDQDVDRMPNLARLIAAGDQAPLTPSFPAVTCPVQCNMTTGRPASEHGVVANGFFWREKNEVEMWTAWNDVVERPRIWDLLKDINPSLTSAVWFPLLAKGCGADYICTPAPIHNPDGSESLWCYTKPEPLYGELRDALGHFPLMNFWGPLAGIQGTAWIVASAVIAAEKFRPNFFYIYLPHLDYAAQKHGPDSKEAIAALGDLDAEIGKLVAGFDAAYTPEKPLWIVASEYAIVPVDHVSYPNRILRAAGLLLVRPDGDGKELIDLEESAAWTLVDHQFGQVFVKDRDAAVIERVVDLFQSENGIADVLAGDARGSLNHERAGDVVLVSEPNSWQAYYYWNDDASAPAFARTVDIHRKPGYDPVELFFDPRAHAAGQGGIPLDAMLVKGSHGAPVVGENQRGVLLSSHAGILEENTVIDADVCSMVLRRFEK